MKNVRRVKTMERQLYIVASVLSTGLLLTTPNVAQAQLTGTKSDEFQHIEQPLPLKAAITTLGIGLIGFELWWFLFSRPQATSDQAAIDQTAIDQTATDQTSAVSDSAGSPEPIPTAFPQTIPLQASAITALGRLENSSEDGIEQAFSEQASHEHDSCEHEAESTAENSPDNVPNNSPPEKLAVGLCALYNGIEMAREMLAVEHRIQPKFSMG
ncbi:MAG: hypothetical protein AAFP03_06450 [Cyanobacteria bacterium J06598_3]